MKASRLGPMLMAMACTGLSLGTASADAPHVYRIPSPDHEQTFAYGSEQSRVWAQRGRDRHLVVLLNFTNDPYVDRQNPRQYDDFTFAFPHVTLGRDDRTFFYRALRGRPVPVATKERDILGIDEIRLLPNAELEISKPHGYLSLSIQVRG